MLSPYRVIDLTNEHGIACGQILADLGAEVIQVEPPGGSTARRIGPWQKNERGPERSLFFWAYARNKRSLVADLENGDDLALVRSLARGADFFIESETPGRLARLGLGYEHLAALNPSLVYVSITAFGQTGPKAHWKGTDLTQMAAGGHLYLSGERDERPVRIRVPQAHAHAAADAAVGALLAHAERRHSGVGQHVDVSLQQSVTLATMFRALDEPMGQTAAQRVAGGVQVGPGFLPSRFRLRDGWMVLGPVYLPSTGHFMDRLLLWMQEEGVGDPAWQDETWGTFALRMMTGEIPPDAFEPVAEAIAEFFSRRTREETMAAAVERKLLLAPALELDQVIDSEQLAVRKFPAIHESSDGTRARYPGPFAKFAASPIRYRLGPPALDQHGQALRDGPPRTPVFHTGSSGIDVGDPRPPLEGVKILDLFWVLAGPCATRMLADYGATVIRVESTQRVDTLRVITPYQFSHPHPEGAGGFQSANANKLGLTLDLSSESGREIALELARWADVVTESFAPGVIDQYGLGWETLRSVNSGLIMISSCLMGQTGPWRNFTGFGNLAATVTSFQHLAGWPDRPPSGPFGAYTDFISARYNAVAILSALEHRERTGEGQHIDQSQAEAALHFLAPAFLDYTVNGRVQGPAGNDDWDCFPHDVYPALGEDRWVAIAVASDAEFATLCDAIGKPELRARRGDRSRVDAELREWTGQREAEEIESSLQRAGIAAHRVLTTPELFADAQLQHRGHYIDIEHAIYQTTTVESTRLTLSRSAARKPTQALTFGRDNRRVLEEILGYSPERIAELAASNVLL